MNKLLLSALCAVGLSVPAFAQTTNVTATNLKMSGTPIATGTITITPVSRTNDPISFTDGTGALNDPTGFTATIVNGVINPSYTVPDQALSTATVAGNPLYYSISISNTYTKKTFSFLVPPGTITGSTFALDHYAPPQVAVVAPTGIIVQPTVPASCSVPSLFYPTVAINGAYKIGRCVGGVFIFDSSSGSGGGTFNYRGAYANANSYAVGDVVTLNGSSYTALLAQAANANQTPGVATMYWGLLAAAGTNGASGAPGTPGTPGTPGAAGQGFNYRGAWAASTAYKPYDVVTYSGSTYESSTTFTSGASFNSANWNVWAAQGQQGTPGTPGSGGSSPTTAMFANFPSTSLQDGQQVYQSDWSNYTGVGTGPCLTGTGVVRSDGAVRLCKYNASTTKWQTADAVKAEANTPFGITGLDGGGTTPSIANPAIPANNINVTAPPYYASPYGGTTTTTSASVASGATSVPVASASTFAVGNGLLVAGGGSTGWTGSDYIGTVTAVSGNNLTVTPALSATAANGAVVKHDDSAALNAITTFCKTSDCGVYFPPIPGTSLGTYRINGPILDTSYSNAMVVLPNAPLTGGTGTSFRMYSSTRPESTANAVTIQSDYAGSGAVSIFGVKVNGGAYGGFNNTYVSLSNLRFSSGNAANQHIFECGFCKGFTTDGHIWVMAQSGNTGIGDPVISNDVDVSHDTLTILNMVNAIRPGEHTYIKSLHGANNTCGVTPDSLTNNSGVTGHENTVTIGNLWNQVSTNLVCGGTTPQNIAIQSADGEVVQNISNDPNNMLTGYVNYHVPYNDGRTSQTMTGAPNVVGSTKLRLINLDTGVCYGSTCPTTAAPTASRTANLVYSWPMNEGSGTSSTDTVSGNNLTLSGVTWTTDSTLGAVPSFSGSSSGAVSASNTNANFTNTQAFSISTWVKPGSTSYGEIISTLLSSSPYTGYVLSAGTTQLQLQLNGTSSGNAIVCTTASGTVPTNALTHVVLTYDGSSSSGGVTFYINGTAVAKNCGTNALSTSIASGQKIGIGQDAGGGNSLNSVIARLRIYSAALTSSDVSTIYANKN